MTTFASKRFPSLPDLTAIVLIFSATLNVIAASADDSFVDNSSLIFDGQTLEGWEGDPQRWQVVDGVIQGRIAPGETLNKNTWLVWQGGELSDFDLRLQFRLTGAAAANSGVQFRCQVDSVDHVSGYQADIDMGQTWLGRVYDEHGRALIVERGSKVEIAADGQRRQQQMAPAHQFKVLFRENEWNDYRIVAVGNHFAVFINGTKAAECLDLQTGEADLKGGLAFQLHSGPETLIEFRDIRLEVLDAADNRLGTFQLAQPTDAVEEDNGVTPRDEQNQPVDLSFESASLEHWTSTGDAFDGQPVAEDGIAARWPGQVSGKKGKYFIGGYELKQDRAQGTLTSQPIVVSHPYASFRFAGGSDLSTRAEIRLFDPQDSEQEIIFQTAGKNREQMEPVLVDLSPYQQRQIVVRLVDENPGAWGHLNFDHFVFHADPPAFAAAQTTDRSTFNVLLQHLVPNPTTANKQQPASQVLETMFVPPGFSAHLIAAEPDLHQTMAFTFDARGRIWVVEGNSYPEKREPGQGLDRILIFSDEDHDGTYESKKTFIEGLNLVSGLEVGFGGVWVGAAPELLFIPDRNQDDVPDAEPTVLLDGFGFADTHETINSFVWGPDGWLYGNQGVFNASNVGPPGSSDDQRVFLAAAVWRFHPEHHRFEVFAHGGSNQWGLDYDEYGQFFMTHCRSYWGRGLTTHVMQGGHYWNQVNSGYVDSVATASLESVSGFPNYLLASARYGHGEGGAGKAGSREVYGGHSHVGTMIYLGDNWPAEYRNHLFTHNLHGHQINHQINLPLAGGFNTVHAGNDVFLCSDPQYVAVDLKYGPDGAVYISDWVDPRHCHNPDVEQWDRRSGRMYRLQYDATYAPSAVDYQTADDETLAAAQLHPNDWHVRTARRTLQERAIRQRVSTTAITKLQEIAFQNPKPARRLRGYWALHAIKQFDVTTAKRMLNDVDSYVRGWGVQLACEALTRGQASRLINEILEDEGSQHVQRCLASSLPNLDVETAWRIFTRIAADAETVNDRDLPILLWQRAVPLLATDLQRSLELANTTAVPALRNYIQWYLAKQSGDMRELLTEKLASADGEERYRLLSILELSVRGNPNAEMPATWAAVSTDLYRAKEVRIRQLGETLGAAYGDPILIDRATQTLQDAGTSIDEKRRSLRLLAAHLSPEMAPLLTKMLSIDELRPQVLPLLTNFDDGEIGAALTTQIPNWPADHQQTALEVLARRAIWSLQLLDAIQNNMIDRQLLNAYSARQMANLNHPELNEKLANVWGTLTASSEEKRAEISRLDELYRSAPLWAYDGNRGSVHFKKLCANCHAPDSKDQSIAPSLAGTSSKGITYAVENIVDPNAVIGRDYQAKVILTSDGRVITGLLLEQTPTAVTVRTATATEVIANEDIDEISTSDQSFMPEGLLNSMTDRERIELLKYLMSL